MYQNMPDKKDNLSMAKTDPEISNFSAKNAVDESHK